jgi:hypothetical protein
MWHILVCDMSWLRTVMPLPVLVAACQSPTSVSTDTLAPQSAKSVGEATPSATASAPAQGLATPRTFNPTTEAAIGRRLADHAATLPKNAVVPRIGLADLAYPRSQAELKAMGGFAAMLLTVICHDPAELPVAQVELTLPNDRLKLALVVSRQTEIAAESVPAAYGRARFDGVFLLPVFLTRKEATVTVYLGSGARPLRVLSFPAGPDEVGLPPGLNFDWAPTQPETGALHKLIDEELPVLAGLKLVGEDKR